MHQNKQLQRGAFCQFSFRWIYYCHSSKSTGKEIGKMHLCAVYCFVKIRFKNVDCCWTSRRRGNILIWFRRFCNNSTAQIRIGSWDFFLTWKATPLLCGYFLGLELWRRFPHWIAATLFWSQYGCWICFVFTKGFWQYWW